MSAPVIPEPAFLGVSFGLPLLVASGVLLIELLARIGAGPARLAGYRPAGPLDLFGTAELLGIIALGTAFLGLALTGLFYPAAVLTTAILAASIGGGYKDPRGFVLPAARAVAGLPDRRFAVLALPALVPFLTASSPWLDEDSLIYHLAFPWQCLKIHRLPLENVIVLFHLPLPSDLALALPLVVGDDRLAKWMIAGAVAALCLFVVGRAKGRNGTAWAWLTPLVAFASSYVFFVSSVPKNDMVASGLLVAGALLWRDGSRSTGAGGERSSPSASFTGAIMLGGAVAAKLTCGPFVAAWLLMHPPRLRSGTGTAVLLMLPVLPWLAKDWLATGNPVFPLFWKLMPSPFWGPENQAAFDNFNMWAPGAERLTTLVPALLAVMWRDFAICLIALPFLYKTGRWRSATALILGFAGVLHLEGIARYLVPGIWLESAEISRTAGNDRLGRVGKWLRALLVLACLGQIFRCWHERPPIWRDILSPAAETRERYLTTYAAAIRDLKTARSPRILLAGGWRSYLIPGRTLFNGYQGETPVVWSQARSSPSPERLRVRFRQLGFRVMLYNFVSGDLVFSLNRSFGWTDPMLRTYADFCRQRLAVLRPPRRIDAENGGFYLLDFDLSPYTGARRDLLFLPTAESALWIGRSYMDQNRITEARREIARVMAVTGPVGHFTSYLAEADCHAQEWKRAHDLLVPWARIGLADNLNLPRLGEAAARLGMYDSAVAILELCLTMYSTDRPNRVILAWTYGKRAQLHTRKNRIGAARADLDMADRTIALVPPDPKESYDDARRLVSAELLGTRGDLLLVQGRAREAREYYRKALDLAPEASNFGRWRRLVGSDSRH